MLTIVRLCLGTFAAAVILRSIKACVGHCHRQDNARDAHSEWLGIGGAFYFHSEGF